MRRSEVHAQRMYAYASLALILTAFGVWNAHQRMAVRPHLLIQGHAIWHILGAVSTYFLYRYYASEEVDGPAVRRRPSSFTRPPADQPPALGQGASDLARA